MGLREGEGENWFGLIIVKSIKKGQGVVLMIAKSIKMGTGRKHKLHINSIEPHSQV